MPHTLVSDTNFLCREREIPDVVFSWEYTGPGVFLALVRIIIYSVEWPADQGRVV